MINLNDPLYTQRSFLTKEGLLSYYSDYDYLKSYFPGLSIGQTINSPFRKDDHPSFSIYYSSTNDCLLFKDFTTDEIGDFVMFIKKLLGLSSYKETLAQIAVDFGLEDKFYISKKILKSNRTYEIKKHNISSKQLAKSKYHLQVKLRSWNTIDSAYWNLFGITIPVLEYYNVYPIQGYFHNDYYIETPQLAYVFIEHKDNKITYKVYLPYADKKNKWRTNHSRDIHQGYNQLPERGNILIITKALKDVMSIRTLIKIPSIAVQAETVNIKKSVIDEYKSRFTHIFTLFDNDQTGKTIAVKFWQEHKIIPMFISNAYTATTDFSDLIQNYGIYEAKSHINTLIYNKLQTKLLNYE